MKSTAIWNKDCQFTVDNGRGHSVLIDLPENKGGLDNGPTSLELCVMSLGGCIGSIFVLLANKMRLTYESLQVEVFAEQAPGTPTISDVHCTLYIKSSEPEDKLLYCLDKTVKHCPVGTLFQQAGVEISHEIIVR